MRLVILLALALVVSTVQCVSACVQDDCGAKTQPCHHHDSSPQAKCSHEIPAAKTPTIAPVVTVPIVVDSVSFTTISSATHLTSPQDATPPSPPLPLRI
jgi:hypothetical protein